MAFQDFDHISERRRNEKRQKLKKRMTIAVVSTVVVLLVAAVVCTAMYKNGGGDSSKASGNSSGGGGNDGGGTKEIWHSQRAIKMICAPTDYKKACESSLSKVVGTNSSAPQPKLLVKAAISVVSDELKKARSKTSSLKFDSPQQKGAYEDCLVLLEDATEELNSSISEVDKQNLGKLYSITPDLENWLSAVMSYQETCIDGFPEGDELKPKIEKAMKTSKELASNALAIISQVSSLFSSHRRRLLDADGVVPAWMSREDRRMLKGKDQKKLTPNAIVAKDGSGNFTTISAALAAIPENRQHRYVIYVKEGIYDESVTVTKKMTNITIYGDGSQKSVVTGSKNFVDGVRTFQTATFVAIGEGFTAQSMGFRNTAGPEKHQAVALRVQSDRSIFLNCRMEGYQDTLYAQTHRQFYRGCLISGTVDFVFGDAAAVLQNCLIKVRKPLDGQQNTVTAQGRLDRRQTTGIVLQNCRILADEGFEAEKRGATKSYLGRPWKEFSKTVVMESEIGDVIHPEGWLAWNGDFALKTLYYAEYNNKGAGANVGGRVKWPGYRVIKKEEAAKFAVGPFLQGDSWLESRAVPVHFGL